MWSRALVFGFGVALLTYGMGAAADADTTATHSTVVSTVVASNVAQPNEPTGDHPRLLIRTEDLPRLRAWATDSNPMWSEVLLPRGEEAKQLMDDGMFDDDEGMTDWTVYPTETFAELFAFLSLVHPDEAERADYAQRARTLLMRIMDEAVKGVAEGEAWRDPYFSIFNRSRWWGEAFPLTVDWIYPHLSDEDKSTIRTVFLRWCEENTHATVTGEFNHPEPIGVVNDPVLLELQQRNRWALNNYWTAHLRQIGMMAMSFDEADDPNGELTGYLASATGAWLYTVDALMSGESRGGMAPEGYEYSPLSLGYVIQLQLALHTAGQDDPERWGPQVVVADQPFWDDVIPATLHALSPRTVEVDDYTGPVYQPAWYGDGEKYLMPEPIGLFGPLGIYDSLTGNTDRLNAARWIQAYTPSGGRDALLYRAQGGEGRFETILYFLLFDPDAPEPTDPRPDLPLAWFAPGIGRLLARTDWGPDAAWFNWGIGWQNIDHQHADGLAFEFYRDGEWLTKEHVGYGYTVAGSDYHNTLALENKASYITDPDDWRYPLLQFGSQWLYVSDDPPGGQVLAVSMNESYVYALGDATGLYNSAEQEAEQVTHASRSIIWLAPDVVVTYDRATSRDDGYFKRYWLQFPTEPEIDGNSATMTTATGQQLFVTSLLPDAATIEAPPAELPEGESAEFEPMSFRLMIEAPGDPADTRFLTVLQGADEGADALEVQAIESTGGSAYAGAQVGTTAVLFPVTLGEVVQSLTYSAPDATLHYVTGLTPEAGYRIRRNGDEVTVTAGGDQLADTGGVLVIGTE